MLILKVMTGKHRKFGRKWVRAGSAILLVVMVVMIGFYWKQYRDLRQKVSDKSDNQGAMDLSPMAKLADQENQNTIAQQATMSASLEEITVPAGCASVPYADPLVGISKFVMRDEITKTGDYWYFGRIVGYKEEKRGACTYSVVEMEMSAGGKKIVFNVTLPSQMVGRGVLGDILPKVLNYKVNKRVELQVRYAVNEGQSLRVELWNVSNFLIN